MSIPIQEAQSVLASSQTEPAALHLISTGPEDKEWLTYSRDLFAAALAHFSKDSRISVRYLSPGKSAIVALICPHDTLERPAVLKFGERDEILREAENYKHLGHLNGQVKPKTPGVWPGDENHRFCALYYEWAGDYTDLTTFGTAIDVPDSPLDKILDALEKLFNDMWLWYEVRSERKVPDFDFGRKQSDILRNLDRPELRFISGITELERIATTGWSWQLRLNVSTSAKITHGDLNAGNILLTRDRLLQPFLIDFQNLRPTACPARDWSKLERELKFVWFFKALSDKQKVNFAHELQTLNNILEHNLGGGVPQVTERFAKVIRLIRQKYLDSLPKEVKDCRMGPVEYFYNLVCWELEYVSKRDFCKSNTEFQQAVLYSARYCAASLAKAIEASNKSRQRSDKGAQQRPSVLADFQPIDSLATPNHGRTLVSIGVAALLIFPFLFLRAYPGRDFHLKTNETAIRERAADLGRKLTDHPLRYVIRITRPDPEEYGAYVLQDGLGRGQEQFNLAYKGWEVDGFPANGDENVSEIFAPSEPLVQVFFSELGEVRLVRMKTNSPLDGAPLGRAALQDTGMKIGQQIFGLLLADRKPTVVSNDKFDGGGVVITWNLPPRNRNTRSIISVELTASGKLERAVYLDENPDQLIDSVSYHPGMYNDLRTLAGLGNLVAVVIMAGLFFRLRLALWRQASSHRCSSGRQTAFWGSLL